MPDATPTRAHDIVVIGASAGGVTAVSELVRRLPSGFPASVFIVLHLSRDSPSLLSQLLDQLGPLPVRTAEDRDPIRPGMVYVAPRDRHMTLRAGQVRVSFGPHQDHHRPSIDVLFRSAALAYGPRVVGVVLTGFLSDGAAGLRAIKDAGGIAVVQDPRTAMHRGMPDSALRVVEPDHCVPLEQIADLLVASTSPSSAQ